MRNLKSFVFVTILLIGGVEFSTATSSGDNWNQAPGDLDAVAGESRSGNDIEATASGSGAQSRAPSRQPAATSDMVVVEYEAAIGAEFICRADRRITGVWKAQEGKATGMTRPEYIVSDNNHCLYGSTGNVWGPLDCPAGNFLIDGNVPGIIKLGAPAQYGRSQATSWRWIDPTLRSAALMPAEEVPMSRFVLANQSSRPVETGGRVQKLDCWVDENPGGMFPKIRCCLVLETLPNDPAPPMEPMVVADPSLPARYCAADKRIPSMPDLDSGSIVLLLSGGENYCLDPDGSFGACSLDQVVIDRGIKEKGIK